MNDQQKLTLEDAIEIVGRRLEAAVASKCDRDALVTRQGIRADPTECDQAMDAAWLAELNWMLRSCK